MTKYCTGFLMASLAISAALQYGQNYLHAATFRTVALSGQPAPGTPGGTNFSGFRSGWLPPSPLLNNGGRTALVGQLPGDRPDEFTYGIWSEGSAGLQLVARGGMPAPGTSSGVSYVEDLGIIGKPVLNDAGQMAFFADLTGGEVNSANDTGIWAGIPGNAALVARGGMPAPGLPSGVNFRGVGQAALNNFGRIAFGATLAGSGVDSTNDLGIWSQGSGNLSLVARSGSQAPGTPSGVVYGDQFYPPALNDAGQTAFQATLAGSGVDLSNHWGIWAERSGGVALVARRGNQAPGMPVGVNFGGFSLFGFNSPVLNNAGRTAFLAGLTNNEQGIWSERSGSVAPVAVSGNHAPGTPDGVNFDFGFSGPALNNTTQTAFFANLRGSGVGPGNNQGVWAEGSDSLKLVAREGSQAPGTPHGVHFGSLSGGLLNEAFFVTPDESPALNDAGQIAFLANLSGTGVDFTNDRGIWATDLSGALHLIARKGDLLEVAPGDFRTIRDVNMVNGTGMSGGRPSGFNDLGQLAFSARFDDSAGIFVSDLVAVPEPKSLALLAVGLLLLACWMFRRRQTVRCVMLALLFVAGLAAPGLAQHKVLHSFNGNLGDGYNPLGSLLQSDSTLYGMTISGGAADYGTIFRIGTDGDKYRVLHSFHTDPNDGREPYYGSLIQSGQTLYGMTHAGGTYTDGTIFRIGTDGTGYSVLHSFAFADGRVPYGSLLHSGSTLYGMTTAGGANDAGTIFRIATDGTGYSVLHSFTVAEGAHPHASLIQSGSTLYGMTTGFRGGVLESRGNIFRIETDGTGFDELHSFSQSDGALPYGSLVQSGSTLYGMTHTGGPNFLDARGTIFHIETDGTGFGLLHAFAVGDGLNPYGSLLLSGSTLYGMATSASAGGGGPGTVFQIGTDGTGFDVIHSFSGSDGGYPHGSLVQSGLTLYGMTTVGGQFADGTIFSLVVPEPSSLALLALALPLVICWNWRRLGTYRNRVGRRVPSAAI